MSKLLIIIALVFAGLFLSVQAKVNATTNVTKSVVLDVGHGGTDTGTTECPALYEKDANLKIGLILQTMLQNAGYTVYMTRTTDVALTNAQRYNFANSTNAQAFVSIHLNGSTDHSKDGTEGYWGKKNKDLALTRTVHASEASELSVPDLGITNFADGILLKTTMPATLTESVFLSNTTECQELSDGTNVRETQIAKALYDGIASYFSK